MLVVYIFFLVLNCIFFYGVGCRGSRFTDTSWDVFPLFWVTGAVLVSAVVLSFVLFRLYWFNVGAKQKLSLPF